MFDFLQLPELTDNYYRSLFFMILIVLSFFSADLWLLEKYPDLNKSNIKLADFFISRLRVFIPAVSLALFLFLIFDAHPKVNMNTLFFRAPVVVSVSFYMSLLVYKSLKEKYSMTFLLYSFVVLISSSDLLDRYPTTTKYLGIGAIAIIAGVIIVLFKNKIKNKEVNEIK